MMAKFRRLWSTVVVTKIEYMLTVSTYVFASLQKFCYIFLKKKKENKSERIERKERKEREMCRKERRVTKEVQNI